MGYLKQMKKEKKKSIKRCNLVKNSIHAVVKKSQFSTSTMLLKKQGLLVNLYMFVTAQKSTESTIRPLTSHFQDASHEVPDG